MYSGTQSDLPKHIVGQGTELRNNKCQTSTIIARLFLSSSGKEVFSLLFSEVPSLMYDYQKKKVSASVLRKVFFTITKKNPNKTKPKPSHFSKCNFCRVKLKNGSVSYNLRLWSLFSTEFK